MTRYRPDLFAILTWQSIPQAFGALIVGTVFGIYPAILHLASTRRKRCGTNKGETLAAQSPTRHTSRLPRRRVIIASLLLVPVSASDAGKCQDRQQSDGVGHQERNPHYRRSRVNSCIWTINPRLTRNTPKHYPAWEFFCFHKGTYRDDAQL